MAGAAVVGIRRDVDALAVAGDVGSRTGERGAGGAGAAATVGAVGTGAGVGAIAGDDALAAGERVAALARVVDQRAATRRSDREEEGDAVHGAPPTSVGPSAAPSGCACVSSSASITNS